MYHYLFGPVPSRRLGASLGIDLIPKKVCSLDCVYCEVGRTTELTELRRSFYSVDEIEAELIDFFSKNEDPDYITFSGSGEPLLNLDIEEMIQRVKKIKPNIPIAVLTNSTLLTDPHVRDAVQKADLVLPSLDSATQDGFEKINRPCKNILIAEVIEGLVEFRKNYRGKIWLEVFILPKYNDTIHELSALKKAIQRISPDRIQLNSLDRPGTVDGLVKGSQQLLEEIAFLIDFDAIDIVAPAQERKKSKGFIPNIEAMIVETISRRPCTFSDLEMMTGLHSNEINKYLSVLEEKGVIQTTHLSRGIFFQLTNKRGE